MVNIIINSADVPNAQPEALLDAARLTLTHHDIPENDIEMSIVIENDEKLQELNYQYRRINAPTDVLSFPSDLIGPETGKRYLGDVVISLARAEAQADIGNHPLEEELQLLVIHGILHLLGDDHFLEHDKNVMWEKKKRILKKLGLNIEIPE